MAYLYDNEQIEKFLWIIVILLAIFFVQPTTSTFVCNPQKCEVTNKNIFNITIHKKKIKISQIERFEIKEYYSMFEGGKRNHYRKTIYAVPKYGRSYRFMGASKSSRYGSIQRTLDKLNSLIPTTQDKIDVNIKL